MGETFYGWGEKRRFHIVGGAWIYIGAKHYTQSNGGASRMTSPPLTLEIYTSIHEISPPWGTTAGGGCVVMTYWPVDG